jgi:amidase
MKDRSQKTAIVVGSLLCLIFLMKALHAMQISRNAGANKLYYNDIETLQKEFAQGSLSARELTAEFLERIHTLDQSGPAVHSVIELNPAVTSISNKLDSEPTHGVLYGIPILIKDNIDTGDRRILLSHEPRIDK